MSVSENFFENLNDTIKMSMQLDDQHCNKIIDFIIQNETVPFDRKIELYKQLDEQKHEHKMNYIKSFTKVLRTIALALLGGKAINTYNDVNTDKSYNKRKAKETKYK